jgi:hypothetical protein
MCAKRVKAGSGTVAASKAKYAAKGKLFTRHRCRSQTVCLRCVIMEGGIRVVVHDDNGDDNDDYLCTLVKSGPARRVTDLTSTSRTNTEHVTTPVRPGLGAGTSRRGPSYFRRSKAKVV